MMIGGGSAFRGTPTPTMLQYYVPNVDEVYARAIATGATVQFELREDHGDRFAAVNDPFGNSWVLSRGPRISSHSEWGVEYSSIGRAVRGERG